MNSSPSFTDGERASWMSLLARAPDAALREAAADYGELPAFQWLRRPETGLAMVRARIGGSGRQFNLGDMSVCRCALRIDSGQTGVAYVAGRDVRRAEHAALFDALMQSPQRDRVARVVLAPLQRALDARCAEAAAQAQATRVDFMTMVRGENA